MSFLFELTIYSLIIFIGYKAYKEWSHKSANNSSHKVLKKPMLRGIKVQPQDKTQLQLSKIVNRDPNFNAEQLIQRIEKAFYIIREAWSSHNLSQVRAFITDGFYERYAIQFDIQKKHHRHRKTLAPKLLSCEIIGVRTDKHFESIHFKISSQARYSVINTNPYKPERAISSANNTSQINKVSPLINDTEYWTYTRLPSNQVNSTTGLTEEICPNCGGKLLLNKFEKCVSCHSLVTSGAYDWVLTKVTDEDEWRFQNATREIEGVAEYLVVDPAFNVSVIEDRVCVIFWRLQKAWLMQNANEILSVTHPDYVAYFAENELNNYYFDHIALSLCEVTSVEFGEEFDKLFVLVKWRAEKVDLISGASSDAFTDTKDYAHHITMIRKTGITSDIEKGLHSLHCFSCGAPQMESHHESCQYCQTRFNDGGLDWVLYDYKPRLERSTQLKGKSFSKKQGENVCSAQIFDPISLLSNLVLIMQADGVLGEYEHSYLNKYVKQHRIPDSVLTDILAKGECGELPMPLPDEKLDATTWLLKMIEMSLADETISKEEKETLLEFGNKFNMLPIDIDLRIKQVKLNKQTNQHRPK